MSDRTRKFKRTIGTRTIEVELDLGDLDPSHDLMADAGMVASQIGLVGELIGATTAAHDVAYAVYRHWRGSFQAGALRREPKLAEWKVKDLMQGDKAFLMHKTEVARLAGDLEFLRTFHSALRVKASMVRAQVDLHRQTEHGTGSGIAQGDSPPRRRRTTAATTKVPSRKTGGSRADRVRVGMGRKRT